MDAAAWPYAFIYEVRQPRKVVCTETAGSHPVKPRCGGFLDQDPRGAGEVCPGIS